MPSSSDQTPIVPNPANNQQYPPVTPRKTVTGGGSRKITDLRIHIAAEMDGEFVTCDIDTFMKHYLPFVPDEVHVKSCVENILKPNNVMDKTETPVFTAFRDTPAINKTVVGQRTEMEVFRPLEAIAKHIADFDFPGEPPKRKRNKFSYRNVPHDTVKSNIEGSNHKIDACFTAEEFAEDGDHRISTWEMAVPIEQKVQDSESDPKKQVDNNEKILSANIQIMNDDARRMFTFGITFEADQMTLWFHSRSHSAVSQSFNFVKDPERLIKIFMSFLFATEEELGYDSNVERKDDATYVFKFIKKDKVQFYRTVGNPISFYRSNNITGRMPRVWKVEAFDPATQKAGKQFVLKDVWIDRHAQTEGDIQSAMFDSINQFGEKEPPLDTPDLREIWEKRKELIRSREYQRLFLTIEDDYNGAMSKETAPGAHRIWGLCMAPPTKYASKGVPIYEEAGQSHPIPTNSRNDIIRGFEPKKQYRVVFKEICQSIGQLKTLGEAIDVIQQVHVALQLLYCGGWVHRDISDGNILAYREDPANTASPWIAKLMDLEYAKKFPPPDNYKASVDPKTGTPYFMPTEILAGQYIYVPGLYASQDPRKEPVGHATTLNLQDQLTRELVIHNFQHDLESLWWLIIWLIASHVKDQSTDYWKGPDFRQAVEECRTWASPIFQNVIDLPKERTFCFYYSLVVATIKFIPTQCASIVQLLEQNRQNLIKHYTWRAQQGKLRDQESYADIHLRFGRFLEGIQTNPTKEWREYSLQAPDPTQPSEPKKSVKGASAANPSLVPPGKAKAKRGPDQNPNLQEQGRPEGSHKGGKKSRRGA